MSQVYSGGFMAHDNQQAAVPIAEAVAAVRAELSVLAPARYRGLVVAASLTGAGQWLHLADTQGDGSAVDVEVFARKAVCVRPHVAEGQVVEVTATVAVNGRGRWYLDAKGVDVVADKAPSGEAKRQELLDELLSAESIQRSGVERARPFGRCRWEAWPQVRRVLVLTSLGSQGWGDFDAKTQGAGRRGVKITPRDVPMQGDHTVERLAHELSCVSGEDADLVFIVRGGGDSHHLQAFDDVELARAVAHCDVEVITAIGHSADVKLIDRTGFDAFITPTEAASVLMRVVGWQAKRAAISTVMPSVPGAGSRSHSRLSPAPSARAEELSRSLERMRADHYQLWRFTRAQLLRTVEGRVRRRGWWQAAALWIVGLALLGVPTGSGEWTFAVMGLSVLLGVAGLVCCLATQRATRGLRGRTRGQAPLLDSPAWAERAVRAHTVRELRMLRHGLPGES